MCDRSIAILQSLMDQNRKRNADALLRAKDLKQKAEEYRMESLAMKVTLDFVGLTFHQLSQSSWTYLNTLSKTAKLLKLSQPSDTNYVLGLMDLRHRTESVERCKSQLRRETAQLEQQGQSMEPLERHLHHLCLDPVFVRINSGRHLRFSWHEQKLYNRRASKNLKQLGAMSPVSHKGIVTKKQELDWLIKKCLAAYSELDRFRHLPPSLTKIKSTVQQMEGEITRLERRLSEWIDSSVL